MPWRRVPRPAAAVRPGGLVHRHAHGDPFERRDDIDDTERVDVAHLDAEFLPQLAAEGGLGWLAGLRLATGQVEHVRGHLLAHHEKPPRTHDDRCHHLEPPIRPWSTGRPPNRWPAA